MSLQWNAGGQIPAVSIDNNGVAYALKLYNSYNVWYNEYDPCAPHSTGTLRPGVTGYNNK